jgi:transposase
MKHLTDFEMGKIIALRQKKMSIRQIGLLLKIAKSTVSNVIKRFEGRGTVVRKKGSGLSFLLNSSHKEYLKKILKKEPKISVPRLNTDLKEKTGMIISCDTIRKELKGQGLKAYSPQNKLELSKCNKLLRFEICQKWTFEPNTFWNTIIFSA